MNDLFPGYLPPFFDVAGIGPQEEGHNFLLNHRVGNDLGSTLVNPFSPKDSNSKLSCNSYLSLPITRAHFPGYRCHLLANDGVFLRMWDLRAEIWFADRPWGNVVRSSTHFSSSDLFAPLDFLCEMLDKIFSSKLCN
jgi:hypothetical protein